MTSLAEATISPATAATQALESRAPHDGTMRCPVCGGPAHEKTELGSYAFRKEDFPLVEHFYLCQECQEEFTTSEQDILDAAQVHNQYRERHGILFPEQIAALREGYGLSASKMAEVLGMGTNSYRQYEKGEIPSDSNAALLALVKNPETFRELALRKRELFTEKELDKLLERIRNMAEKPLQALGSHYWDRFRQPDQFQGYAAVSKDKLQNMILFFLERARPFMVKLNKLLFYADFLHYKRSGRSISGTRYKAIQMGPVPKDYDILFGLLESEGVLEKEYVSFSNREGAERLVGTAPARLEAFEPGELACLEEVAAKMGSLNTAEIVEMSHQEQAWRENVDKKRVISYQKHAFFLQNV